MSRAPCGRKPRSPPERAVLSSSETSAATFANFSPPIVSRLRISRIFALALMSDNESAAGGIWITCSLTCAGTFGNWFWCARKYASASAAGTACFGSCLSRNRCASTCSPRSPRYFSRSLASVVLSRSSVWRNSSSVWNRALVSRSDSSAFSLIIFWSAGVNARPDFFASATTRRKSTIWFSTSLRIESINAESGLMRAFWMNR